MSKQQDTKDESAPLFFLLALLTCIVVPWTLTVIWSFLFPGRAEVQKAFPQETDAGKRVRYYQTPAIVAKREAAIAKLRSRRRLVTSGFICRAIGMFWLGCWLIYITVQVTQVLATSKMYQNFDPHRILELRSGSTSSEVKKAFRRLSLQYHPDKPTGNADKFMLVKKAYDVLTDPTAKYNFDRWGNPDGPTHVEISCALPSISQEMQGAVLVGFVLLFVIGVPTMLFCCIGGEAREHGLLVTTLEVLRVDMKKAFDKKKGMDISDVHKSLINATAVELESSRKLPLEGDIEALEILRKATGVAGKTGTGTMASKEEVLLATHLQRKDLSMCGSAADSFRRDLEQLLPLWQSMLAVLLKLCMAKGSKKSLAAVLQFHQCLIQGLDASSVSEGGTQLLQVPHLTADHVQQLKKAKLTGLSSLLDMPADKRRAKLEAIGLGAPALADIDEFVAVFPRVSVGSVRVFVDDGEEVKEPDDEEDEGDDKRGDRDAPNAEDEIYEGDTATVEVVLIRSNLEEGDVSGGAHAPLYPDASLLEVWWVMLTLNISAKEEKMCLASTCLTGRETKARIKFMVPREGKLRGKVQVVSATYAGLDMEELVSFQARKAQGELPDGADSGDDDDEED